MVPKIVKDTVEREFGDSMKARKIRGREGCYLVVDRVKTVPPVPTGSPVVLRVIGDEVELIHEPESFDFL